MPEGSLSILAVFFSPQAASERVSARQSVKLKNLFIIKIPLLGKVLDVFGPYTNKGVSRTDLVLFFGKNFKK